MDLSAEVDSVRQAAEHVVTAFGRAGWTVARAGLFVAGADPLWDTIAALLRTEGATVTIRQYSLGATPLSVLGDVAAAGLCPGDVAIIHDRIRPGTAYPICAAVQEIVGTGARLAFIEFPDDRTPASTRLRPLYLRAMALPVADLTHRMAALRATLAPGPIELESESGVLRMQAQAVFDDFTVLDVAAPILQFPLGEVWMIVRDVEGSGRLDGGSGGPIGITASAGGLLIGADPAGPAVELGIGVNPAAAVLPTSLCEKAAGRLHLGIGDDALIGGSRPGDSHYDVLLSADTCLR